MSDARKQFLADLATATKKKVRTVASKPPVGQIIHYAPTGLVVVNQYLLGGGFPCGRLSEIAGDEGIGKSSLLFSTIAECQQIGWNTMLYESESRLDSRRLDTWYPSFLTLSLTLTVRRGVVKVYSVDANAEE